MVYDPIAETNENTVVAVYEPIKRRSEGYQSEAELEKEFIADLQELGYTYLAIHSEDDLKANLRKEIGRLNGYAFTDAEWQRFFADSVANANDDIPAKSRKIQEDYVQVLRRDDGTSKNIMLIDKKNVHNNSLQVINQYTVGKEGGAKQGNRYDVTILVNGLPLVHVELKRRGVAIKEAFNQIERYQKDSFWAGSGLFEYVQIFVISNGTNTKYYSNSTRMNAIKERSGKTKKIKTSNSFEFTSFWADAENRVISDLVDFTQTFFARHTILNILTRYCVFTSENMLLVMRPYQIVATERILNRIEIANNYRKYGTVEGGGYIWHTTGSGKTLTSFKTARLACALPYIDKVVFVVDRKDLDYQTMREYDRFEKGCANSNTSTAILKRQLEDESVKIIITTIQKLSNFIAKNPQHPIYRSHVVMIFDECHRSQFGDMHAAIVKHFKKYHIFGFTGTPIFAVNAAKSIGRKMYTTEQVFGKRLHSYTVIDAIRDKNVLPFKVDYIKTMDVDDDVQDEAVYDIDRKRALEAPERVEKVVEYVLEHFDLKTYRGSKSYWHSVLGNIGDVATAGGRAEEAKEKRRLSGFNAIFATSSIPMAKKYYSEFKRQMALDPAKRLKIATIYSYAANEDTEENSESMAELEASDREFLESAICDYNQMFRTNYDAGGEKFQNYYKDVSLRMKSKELDLLIIVDMFLTGFDATTLNTLWVDKNLKMHGLLQAFSRTNRILNSIKNYGNIVCFRNLKSRVDESIALFSDNKAGGIVILRPFEDYYNGYDEDGKHFKGYAEIVKELQGKFPAEAFPLVEAERKKEFIMLFGAYLRMRNLLRTFDQFEDKEIMLDREFQDYKSRYLDLRDEIIKPKPGETSIIDDVVFEVEFIRQDEINIDNILRLLQKYRQEHCEDGEIIVKVRKLVESNTELRSKKALIEDFIARLNDLEDESEQAGIEHDIAASWQKFVKERREEAIKRLIEEEKLKEPETRKLLAAAFRDGELKTAGTEIDNIMPAMSFFKSPRAEKKQGIVEKLKTLLEEFFGIASPEGISGEEGKEV